MKKLSKTHSPLLGSDIHFGAVLGRGSYSVVVHAAVPKLGAEIAVKIFSPAHANLFHLLQAEYNLQS
jgi:hypothetical protein